MIKFSDTRYDEVVKMAKDVGQLLLRYQGANLEVENKSNDRFDPVTKADKEADKIIRERLTKLFPGDLILSEESEIIPESYDGAVWMVDPLDGTKAFIRGSPNFGVHIGLALAGVPIFGVVDVPAQNKTYVGEISRGSFLLSGKDDQFVLKTSESITTESSTLIVREDKGEVRASDQVINSIPVKGQIELSGIGVCLNLIAEGKADAYIATNRRLSKWDTCAPEVVLREAGGVVSDLLGAPLNYKQAELKWNNSMLASNGKNQNNFLTYSKQVLSRL